MQCDEDEQYFVREIELDDKEELRIYQEVNSDVGGVVWDSSIVACYYFLKNRHYWKNKKVLELGCGTGICSIVLAMLGAQVNATDLSERLSLIQLNVSKNEQFLKATTGCVSIEAFDWNEPPLLTNHYDVVLLVDAIYYLKGVQSLMKSLCAIDADEFLCVYEERDIGEACTAQKCFFESLQSYFIVTEVPATDLDPFYSDPLIHVIRFIRHKNNSIF